MNQSFVCGGAILKREEIVEKVKSVLCERLAVSEEDVLLEAALKDDLDADSLDLVEITIVLEDFYGVSLPSDELADIKTVADIVEFIEAKLLIKD